MYVTNKKVFTVNIQKYNAETVLSIDCTDIVLDRPEIFFKMFFKHVHDELFSTIFVVFLTPILLYRCLRACHKFENDSRKLHQRHYDCVCFQGLTRVSYMRQADCR